MKALLRNVRERKTEQRNARIESLQNLGKKDRQDTSDDVFKALTDEQIAGKSFLLYRYGFWF